MKHSIYSYTYELINTYLEQSAVGEEVARVKAVLFDYFHQEAKKQQSLSPTSIECLSKYATNTDCLKILVEFYEKSPTSFSIPKVYLLVQMILGFGYGGQIDEAFVSKLMERAREEDLTNGFEVAQKQNAILRLSPAERLEILTQYMLNPGQKFSVSDIEDFCGVFTSRYLPENLKSEYLPTYFDLLGKAFEANLPMYSRVVCCLKLATHRADPKKLKE